MIKVSGRDCLEKRIAHWTRQLMQDRQLDGEATQGVNHVKTDTKQRGVTKTGMFHKKHYHKPQQSYMKDCHYCGTGHKKELALLMERNVENVVR